MSTEDLVGARVLIHLDHDSFQGLEVQGIEGRQFVARVLGVDGFGLWVENPNYCTTPTYTDAGEYIEIADRVEICHRAVVLLQWGFIQTIIHFPDRATYGSTLGESEIGFKVPRPGGAALPGRGRQAATQGRPTKSSKAVKRG